MKDRIAGNEATLIIADEIADRGYTQGETSSKCCVDCVNRLICPNYASNNCCSGHNDEGVFKGLLSLMFIGTVPSDYIEKRLNDVKRIQSEKRN